MTKDEIKLVTFVLVALLAGAATKYYRRAHPQLPMSTPLPKHGAPRVR
jgi:hypothetical protein